MVVGVCDFWAFDVCWDCAVADCGVGRDGVAGLIGDGMAWGRDVLIDGCADGGVRFRGCVAGGGTTAGARSA